MKLIKMLSGMYKNTESILAIYTFENTIYVDCVDQDEIKIGDYTTPENMWFALADLIRRLTEDHRLIRVMTDEEAAEELKRRSGDGRDQKESADADRPADGSNR